MALASKLVRQLGQIKILSGQGAEARSNYYGLAICTCRSTLSYVTVVSLVAASVAMETKK